MNIAQHQADRTLWAQCLEAEIRTAFRASSRRSPILATGETIDDILASPLMALAPMAQAPVICLASGRDLTLILTKGSTLTRIDALTPFAASATSPVILIDAHDKRAFRIGPDGCLSTTRLPKGDLAAGIALADQRIAARMADSHLAPASEPKISVSCLGNCRRMA